MTYTVKYKLKNQWFWRSLKKIKGDGFVEGVESRFFIKEDETRYEIPMRGTCFSFSLGRFVIIKQNIEKEAGTKLS